jgi:radical SAM protein with 4Fe4S-binding SPASM domain
MTALLNLWLGKLPQYTRKARHLHQAVRHSTPKKIVNMVKAELALRTGKTSLTSLPYVYIIDPCNVCNLRCPLCPTGNQTGDRPKKMMTYECFTGIVDEIRDYAVEVILHNWGESLLHPRIFDMIRYASSANIGTNISSHFNNVTDEMVENLIDSGLEHLTVSLDGASQAVYEQYRVRGNLQRALDALGRLQARKRARRSSTPIVEWQYIVMKHNEHEIPAAEQLARDLGVERFRLLSVGLPFDDLENLDLAGRWISDNPRYRGYHPEPILERGYLYDESCFYLYRAFTVNPDGAVAPCCAISQKKWDFGHIPTQTVREIWNGRHYRSARSLFSDQPIADPVRTVCDGCPLYRQRKHRAVAKAGRS